MKFGLAFKFLSQGKFALTFESKPLHMFLNYGTVEMKFSTDPPVFLKWKLMTAGCIYACMCLQSNTALCYCHVNREDILRPFVSDSSVGTPGKPRSLWPTVLSASHYGGSTEQPAELKGSLTDLLGDTHRETSSWVSTHLFEHVTLCHPWRVTPLKD